MKPFKKKASKKEI